MKSYPKNRRPIALLGAAVGFAYPFVIQGAWSYGPIALAAIIAATIALRWVAGRTSQQLTAFAFPSLVAGCLTFIALMLAPQMGPLLYPAFMSTAYATAFGLSLFQEKTLIEVFATAYEPNPSPAARLYMRKVTGAWCIFLTANACVSLFTVWLDQRDIWTIYNGFVSYILMGLFFLLEYGIRCRQRERQAQ